MLIYITTLFISVILIILSLFPGGYAAVGDVMMGIGCSGLAAAIMAIFLERANKKSNKEMNEFYRYTYFNDLNQQLKKLFERLLWFDKAIVYLGVDKDLDYYLSYDFLLEAGRLEIDEILHFEEADTCVKALLDKYDEDNWDDVNVSWNQVNKMLQIIGKASEGVFSELDRIKKDKFFLIHRGLIEVEDIEEIIGLLEGYPRMLSTGKSKSITYLEFPWKVYSKLRSICGYRDEFYISWHSCKDFINTYVDSKLA